LDLLKEREESLWKMQETKVELRGDLGDMYDMD